WPGEGQGGYPYAGQPQQGWSGEVPGGYPNIGHQQQGVQSYPYAPSSSQEIPGTFGTGTSSPQAPDYSLWESYVDYHVPPYQPDFPVKPRKD
ncbi:MAG TPA: hypothetical protein VFH42_08530, partial [Sporolactobacillaceae bacterium]|nr:hypothetical protein [Sporolactobacillaceae bacterium]